MPQKTWFSIAKNKADAKAADVSIHAEIGYWGISAKQFLEQLRLLGDDLETINLSLHSPGGEVLDGWAIYNALKLHPAKVIVTIKGLAASMASVIMLAGDEIRIPRNAFVMIHRVSGGTWGDADDLREYAETMEKLEDGIIAAYVERTGLKEKEVRAMVDKETWMTGVEAVDKGFADKLLDAQKTNASAEWRQHFTRPPRALFDMRGTPERSEPESAPDTLLDMKPEEIQSLITNGIAAGLKDHQANTDKALKDLREGIGAEVKNAVKTEVETGMKPITDRLDKVESSMKPIEDFGKRMDKMEGLVKAGIPSAAGGGNPVPGAGGEGGETDPVEPKTKAELEKALGAAKNFSERRTILAAWDKRQSAAA